MKDATKNLKAAQKNGGEALEDSARNAEDIGRRAARAAQESAEEAEDLGREAVDRGDQAFRQAADRGAKTVRHLTGRGAEVARDSLEQGRNAIRQQSEQLREFAAGSANIFGVTAEAGRRDLDVLMELGASWSRNLQELGSENFRASQENMGRVVESIRGLREVQSKLLREAVSGMLQGNTRLFEISARMAQDASEHLAKADFGEDLEAEADEDEEEEENEGRGRGRRSKA